MDTHCCAKGAEHLDHLVGFWCFDSTKIPYQRNFSISVRFLMLDHGIDLDKIERPLCAIGFCCKPRVEVDVPDALPL
jgi:hypothetical protein